MLLAPGSMGVFYRVRDARILSVRELDDGSAPAFRLEGDWD